MPTLDIEKRNAYARNYYAANSVKLRQYQRDYYAATKENHHAQ